MAVGQTSLGMRHNQVNFFEGVIAKVRFTPSVVNPADFMSAYAPGDYDKNGAIDGADYDKWKADFGTTVASLGDGADGNRDGEVNTADYTVWRDNLPAGAGAASVPGESVPEPATIRLVAVGFLTLIQYATCRR